MQNLVSLFFGDDSKAIGTGEVQVGNEIFGAYITNVQIVIIVVSIILCGTTLVFCNTLRSENICEQFLQTKS